MIGKFKLFESVIDMEEGKKYLLDFFYSHKQQFQSCETISDFETFFEEIDYKLSSKYIFYVDDENNNTELNSIFEVEIIPHKKENVICIDVNVKEFIKQKNKDKIIQNLIIKIVHEFIHIEQYSNGLFLMPIGYDGKYFNRIKNKIKSLNIDSQSYNTYLSHPYEIMAVANTIIEDLYSNYSKKEILNILKGIHEYKIPVLELELLPKIKGRLLKYLYEYTNKLK